MEKEPMPDNKKETLEDIQKQLGELKGLAMEKLRKLDELDAKIEAKEADKEKEAPQSTQSEPEKENKKKEPKKRTPRAKSQKSEPVIKEPEPTPEKTERQMSQEEAERKVNQWNAQGNREPVKNIPPVPKTEPLEEKTVKFQKEKSKERKPKIVFDDSKVAEELNRRIQALEANTGAPLTPEKKSELFNEVFLAARVEYNNQKKEASSMPQKAWAYTTEKWKNLDNTGAGRLTKVALSAGFMGASVFAAGAAFGVLPPSGIGQILANRVILATGMNSLLTWNKSKNLLPTWAKGKGVKYVLMAGGLGISFAVSSGLSVVAIGAGGMVVRTLGSKLDKYITNKKIGILESNLKNLSNKSNPEIFNEPFDIEKYTKYSQEFSSEHEKILKKLARWRATRGALNVFNWAATAGAGALTLAEFERIHKVEYENAKIGEPAPEDAPKANWENIRDKVKNWWSHLAFRSMFKIEDKFPEPVIDETPKIEKPEEIKQADPVIVEEIPQKDPVIISTPEEVHQKDPVIISDNKTGPNEGVFDKSRIPHGILPEEIPQKDPVIISAPEEIPQKDPVIISSGEDKGYDDKHGPAHGKEQVSIERDKMAEDLWERNKEKILGNNRRSWMVWEDKSNDRVLFGAKQFMDRDLEEAGRAGGQEISKGIKDMQQHMRDLYELTKKMDPAGVGLPPYTESFGHFNESMENYMERLYREIARDPKMFQKLKWD